MAALSEMKLSVDDNTCEKTFRISVLNLRIDDETWEYCGDIPRKWPNNVWEV